MCAHHAALAAGSAVEVDLATVDAVGVKLVCFLHFVALFEVLPQLGGGGGGGVEVPGGGRSVGDNGGSSGGSGGGWGVGVEWVHDGRGGAGDGVLGGGGRVMLLDAHENVVRGETLADVERGVGLGVGEAGVGEVRLGRGVLLVEGRGGRMM